MERDKRKRGGNTINRELLHKVKRDICEKNNEIKSNYRDGLEKKIVNKNKREKIRVKMDEREIGVKG